MNLTFIPGSPLILSLHSLLVSPTTLWESISMISSPHLSPLFAAGESL